jgi:squalene synthase HpnC
MSIAEARCTDLLDRMGPDRCERMGEADARAWCVSLARARGENFPVLTALLPKGVHEDFGAIYAFCRWADDLGDEAGDPMRALELLAWWRSELQACFAGEPRHPVFTALRPTILRHALPIEPFDHLIQAFEWDNRKNRWATMDELLQSCALSADPVGRIVLMTLGESRSADAFAQSDAICTGLQLINHWQDVRRDLLERDRIYIPAESSACIPDFERRLRITAEQGWAPDREFLAAYRAMLAGLVNHAEGMFDRGEPLLRSLRPDSRPVIWLFQRGGREILARVRAWDHETCIRRPRVPLASKLRMIATAWWHARRARA